MKFSIVCIIVLLVSVACKQNDRPDVGGLLQDRKIIRFDRDVFALDRNDPDVGMLARKYGRYFDLYTVGVLQLGNPADERFKEYFSFFLKDSVINEVYDSVAVAFRDISAQEKELAQAWAYYAYYFPGKTIPDVYTHVSGFNQSIVVDSAIVGVSLDNYLGENCVFYDMMGTPIPKYARMRMTPDYFVKEVLFGWLSTEFAFHPEKNDLISGMLYQGKLVYLLEKILPDTDKSKLFDFTKEQLAWCVANEADIWGFLVENQYVFSTDQMLLVKYLNEAPFTVGMPSESPGKTVVWTGYKIIDAYMKKTEASLKDLMGEDDYHKILRITAYRP